MNFYGASEPLAKRKADGIKLGRPAGPAKKLRLDVHADKIDNYLAKNIDKCAIAELLDVSPNTLYAWLKVRRGEASRLLAAPLTPGYLTQ